MLKVPESQQLNKVSHTLRVVPEYPWRSQAENLRQIHWTYYGIRSSIIIIIDLSPARVRALLVVRRRQHHDYVVDVHQRNLTSSFTQGTCLVLHYNPGIIAQSHGPHRLVQVSDSTALERSMEAAPDRLSQIPPSHSFRLLPSLMDST